MEEKVRELLKENYYSINEGLDAINFVYNLMEMLTDETKENFPHATTTIHEMETALHRIFTLSEQLEELE